MDMLAVKDLHEIYKKKAKSEKGTNPETIKVCDLTEEVIRLHNQAYEKADELVFNDIIKLLDKKVEELERLIESI